MKIFEKISSEIDARAHIVYINDSKMINNLTVSQ